MRAIVHLYMDATLGCCAVCERLLPPPPLVGRIRRICKDAECRKVYHRLYRVDRSAREGRKPRDVFKERP